MLLRRHTTVHKYLPFLPVVTYTTGFGFLIICYNLTSNTHLKIRPVRLIVCLEEQKVVGRLARNPFALFAAISYYPSIGCITQL